MTPHVHQRGKVFHQTNALPQALHALGHFIGDKTNWQAVFPVDQSGSLALRDEPAEDFA